MLGDEGRATFSGFHSINNEKSVALLHCNEKNLSIKKGTCITCLWKEVKRGIIACYEGNAYDVLLCVLLFLLLYERFQSLLQSILE